MRLRTFQDDEACRNLLEDNDFLDYWEKIGDLEQEIESLKDDHKVELAELKDEACRQSNLNEDSMCIIEQLYDQLESFKDSKEPIALDEYEKERLAALLLDTDYLLKRLNA